jgi:hypothetical protein
MQTRLLEMVGMSLKEKCEILPDEEMMKSMVTLNVLFLPFPSLILLMLS